MVKEMASLIVANGRIYNVLSLIIIRAMGLVLKTAMVVIALVETPLMILFRVKKMMVKFRL
jgi:hypothetical protein